MNLDSESILFSCVRQKAYADEQIVPDLTLLYLESGTIELQFAQSKYVANAGSITLIRKNELVKSLKIPDENGQPCKSVNIFLTPETLKKYATKNKIELKHRYSGISLTDVSNSKFIKAYFQSLLPYFNHPEKLIETLALLKTTEAITLLLEYDQRLEDMMFDLSEPHKINLEKFMNENFTYNIPLSEFARLTGRSLSTFKRDFKNIFDNTPERWLKNRRLQEAKLLIKTGQKPVDIYYKVGFENFSHFSTEYKKKFGQNASGK
ncbi:MAG: helix-turn-helix transcriptional regulator [Chitinophagaceae bacterium]|nr:helix-turn-helix transcriptional regulator [Chitinophagaceae bacterium]